MQFEPRNILVIDFGQLGDVVMSLPALRAIRARFPYAQITVAVGKPGGELIHLSGYANEVLEVDRVALRDGPKLISIGRIVKFVAGVRKSICTACTRRTCSDSCPARLTGFTRDGKIVRWICSRTSTRGRTGKEKRRISSIATSIFSNHSVFKTRPERLS